MGDVIHALNGEVIDTLAELKSLVDKLKPGEPAVMHIERYGRLSFIAREIDN